MGAPLTYSNARYVGQGKFEGQYSLVGEFRGEGTLSRKLHCAISKALVLEPSVVWNAVNMFLGKRGKDSRNGHHFPLLCISAS